MGMTDAKIIVMTTAGLLACLFTGAFIGIDAASTRRDNFMAERYGVVWTGEEYKHNSVTSSPEIRAAYAKWLGDSGILWKGNSVPEEWIVERVVKCVPSEGRR